MVEILHVGASRHWIPPLDLSTTSNRSQCGFERHLAQLREQQEISYLVSTSRNIAFRRLRHARLRSDAKSPAFVEATMRAAVDRVLCARLERKRVLDTGVMEDE